MFTVDFLTRSNLTRNPVASFDSLRIDEKSKQQITRLNFMVKRCQKPPILDKNKQQPFISEFRLLLTLCVNLMSAFDKFLMGLKKTKRAFG